MTHWVWVHRSLQDESSYSVHTRGLTRHVDASKLVGFVRDDPPARPRWRAQSPVDLPGPRSPARRRGTARASPLPPPWCSGAS